MVEGVESINRDFQLGHAVLAASAADAGQSRHSTSSRDPGGAAVLAFGSAEVYPLCKMKVDTGVARPCSRIASDSRRAGSRHKIAVVKIAGGDVERDSGTQINNCSGPEAPAETVGADQVEPVAAVVV